MILAIDAGNSNVVMGVWNGKNWIHTWRIETVTDLESELFYLKQLRERMLEADLYKEDIQKIVYSSVVPSINPSLISTVEHLLNSKPLVLNPKAIKNLTLDIEHPEEIGSDLVANAYGALKM